MPLQISSSFKTKENQFIWEHKNSHYTIKQISNKYNISVTKLNLILPKADKVSPYRQHTRLWVKTSVGSFFETYGKH